MDYSSTKEIIHSTHILSDDDAAFIDSNIAAIQSNWEKRQQFRTETEMRVSVLNDTKFPTPASKYWQSVREQAVFYEGLVQLSFEYRRNKIKQQKIRRKIDKCADDLKSQSLAIDLEEARFGQMNMERVAHDRMREIRLWAAIMEECVIADPHFDSDNVDTHQFVSYLLRWHNQLAALDSSTSSVSEVANLTGQYKTALVEAHRREILLPSHIRKDALRLKVPVYTGAMLESEDNVQQLGNVSFSINGVGAGQDGL